MKNFILLIFTFLSINSVYSQATCADIEPICSNGVAPTPSVVGTPNLGSPGCLGSAPNANWYSFQASSAGPFTLNLHQGDMLILFVGVLLQMHKWQRLVII